MACCRSIVLDNGRRGPLAGQQAQLPGEAFHRSQLLAPCEPHLGQHRWPVLYQQTYRYQVPDFIRMGNTEVPERGGPIFRSVTRSCNRRSWAHVTGVRGSLTEGEAIYKIKLVKKDRLTAEWPGKTIPLVGSRLKGRGE